jgi:DNA-directed RNA polymerase subunit RPC12/RpoP
MTYNFYCFKCGDNFCRTEPKLIRFKNEWGNWEGIKCPLCGGNAKVIGVRTLTPAPNGDFGTNHTDSFKEL